MGCRSQRGIFGTGIACSTGPAGTLRNTAFTSPANVVHNDIVYAKGCPVEVKSIVLHFKAGGSQEIMRDCVYTVF